ncbi:MAG: DUF29 domain-containing protein [Phormidesmis sp.]
MTTSPFLKQNAQSLYEADYAQWIEATLQKLQQQDYAAVDWENLIEEIEDMGRRERRALVSNLIVLLVHLLKWQYQPERRSGSWSGSIVEHRRRINQALKDSPSLKTYLTAHLNDAYDDALEQAAAETMLPVKTFPAKCPYEIEQILERGFLSD